LEHYTDAVADTGILHRFDERKLVWLERDTVTEQVQTPTNIVSFGHSNVVPESLLAAPDIGGGLYLANDGGAFSLLTQDTDYVLPQDGGSGLGALI
jgi:hypothetical protein